MLAGEGGAGSYFCPCWLERGGLVVISAHVGWRGRQVVVSAHGGWRGRQVVVSAHVGWRGGR
jgi:hypothetical protein